jgi:hypothetical protein
VTTTHLIIVCITLLLLALGSGVVLLALRGVIGRARDFDPIPLEEDHGPAVGTTLAVHVISGQSLRGKLAWRDADVFVLSEPEILAGGESRPLGGDVVRIPTGRIDWFQEL